MKIMLLIDIKEMAKVTSTTKKWMTLSEGHKRELIGSNQGY